MVTEVNGSYGTQNISSTTPSRQAEQSQTKKFTFFKGNSSSNIKQSQEEQLRNIAERFKAFLRYTVGSYDCKVDDFLKDLSKQDKELLLKNFDKKQLKEDYEGCLRAAAKGEIAAQETTIINCILYPNAVFKSNGTDNNGEYHEYHSMHAALQEDINKWVTDHGFSSEEEAREVLKTIPSYRYDEANNNKTISMGSKFFADREGTGKVSKRPYVISELTGEKLYDHVQVGNDPTRPEVCRLYRNYDLAAQDAVFGV